MKKRAEIKKPVEILVATQNRGKIREIQHALRGLGFRVYGVTDFLNVPKIEEDGTTFAENALKKGRFYSQFFGKLTIADDSGLEVNALKGLPGVRSSRYAGEKASDGENNRKLLAEMDDIPSSKRGARFRCAMAIVSIEGKEAVTEGICKGRIGFKPVGKKGFGYDPLFILSRDRRTMAQLSVKEKNRVSHRGKALRKLRKLICAFTDC